MKIDGRAFVTVLAVLAYIKASDNVNDGAIAVMAMGFGVLIWNYLMDEIAKWYEARK